MTNICENLLQKTTTTPIDYGNQKGARSRALNGPNSVRPQKIPVPTREISNLRIRKAPRRGIVSLQTQLVIFIFSRSVTNLFCRARIKQNQTRAAELRRRRRRRSRPPAHPSSSLTPADTLPRSADKGGRVRLFTILRSAKPTSFFVPTERVFPRSRAPDRPHIAIFPTVCCSRQVTRDRTLQRNDYVCVSKRVYVWMYVCVCFFSSSNLCSTFDGRRCETQTP